MAPDCEPCPERAEPAGVGDQPVAQPVGVLVVDDVGVVGAVHVPDAASSQSSVKRYICIRAGLPSGRTAMLALLA